MWKRIRAWWAAERAIEEVMSLDDRLLADIGLDRAGLRERVRGVEDAPPSGHETRLGTCGPEALRF
jgi:Domain of unknown function (DUF1127)